MNDDSLFCSKPFEWLEVSVFPRRGETYLCCPVWLPSSVGNALDSPTQDLWNGPRAQAIRQSIHEGTFEHCNRHCPFLHSRSGPVRKKSTIRDPGMRQIIETRATKLPRGPTVMNAAFDRSCNLSCPSCRKEKIIEVRGADEIIALQDKLAREVFHDLRVLYITGSGDAFGSPYFNRWLRSLKREQVPNLTSIHLHTNAQLWTPKMWAKIPQEVRHLIRSCEISIDAASAETYAHNRRGGAYDVLLENLAFIRCLRDTGHLQYVKVHMVVQANNYREMPAFAELGAHFRADRIYFSRLVNWGTYRRTEYRARAVHDPEHPEHAQLLEVLEHELLREPRVDLGNLAGLSRSPRPPTRRPSTPVGMEVENLIG